MKPPGHACEIVSIYIPGFRSMRDFVSVLVPLPPLCLRDAWKPRNFRASSELQDALGISVLPNDKDTLVSAVDSVLSPRRLCLQKMKRVPKNMPSSVHLPGLWGNW